MVDVSRRLFLRGAIGVAAAAVVANPVFAETLPRIVGDGAHDDTAGLQALLNRKPCLIEGNVVHATDGIITLPHGTFLINNTINVRHQQDLIITGGTFIAGDDMPANGVMLSVEDCERCVFQHMNFRLRLHDQAAFGFSGLTPPHNL